MNTIVLFDTEIIRQQLMPLTITRAIAACRIGIFTIAEKWQKYFPEYSIFIKTESHLQYKYPEFSGNESDVIWINGALLPDKEIVEAINNLQKNENLWNNDNLLLAHKGNQISFKNAEQFTSFPFEGVNLITRPWEFFTKNASQIQADFNLLPKNNNKITDPHTIIYAPENVYIEEGAKIKACIINAENGPVYIGKNAEIKMGALIEGPLALCEGARVNMGAKIRPACTVGPYSVVGGEVNNSVLFGYSNKGHEGYLGNSVLGEWCNLGADTNNSNLKNNFSKVKIWDYSIQGNTNTGLTSCGLIMGDHSKAGINTMFNTGTVVGVGANIFGGGFPQKHIPSFTWGGVNSSETYSLDKFHESAEKWMSIRNVQYTEEDKACMNTIFQQSNQ